MKKLLILFLSLAVFTACDKDDDDTDNTGTDPIVGTWVLMDVQPDLFDPQGCDDSSTITFNENGTGNGIFFLESNECEPSTSSVEWTKTDNVYTIEIPLPLVGNQPGTVDFQNNNSRFVFSPQGIPGTSLTFDRVEE